MQIAGTNFNLTKTDIPTISTNADYNQYKLVEHDDKKQGLRIHSLFAWKKPCAQRETERERERERESSIKLRQIVLHIKMS